MTKDNVIVILVVIALFVYQQRLIDQKLSNYQPQIVYVSQAGQVGQDQPAIIAPTPAGQVGQDQPAIVAPTPAGLGNVQAIRPAGQDQPASQAGISSQDISSQNVSTASVNAVWLDIKLFLESVGIYDDMQAIIAIIIVVSVAFLLLSWFKP